MKKFLTIALCATVALASCSKSDDETKPVIKGATQVKEDFNTGVKDAKIEFTGWSTAVVKGTIDWKVGEFNTNRYPQMTVFGAPAGEFESWLVSKAINVTDAKIKSFSFDAAMGYWADNSSLEVYVMTDSLPAKGNPIKLEAKLPTKESVQWGWYNSGNIDLSKYSGTIYIGFKYKATTTDPKVVTTFRLDNFKFNVEVAKGDVAENPFSVADVIATQDNSIKWVKGFVVGFAVSAQSGGGFSIKNSNFAAGDVTNIVLAPTKDETDPTKCIAVKLMTGAPRNELGLGTAANQVILQKEISLRGTVTASFGKPGMVDVADFKK